jgi:uncharacterized protein (TIGR00290 family)
VRTWLAWSSGKDSAWALHLLRRDLAITVDGLFTTVNEAYDRVAMHAVRKPLLEAQARAAGVALHVIPIPSPCPNAAYEAAMTRFIETARAAGVSRFAFGDIFLEDVRRYRERQLAGTGIEPLFPLWGRETLALAREMIDGGLRAVITCVDPRQAPRAWAGRIFDRGFLPGVPGDVDPCGERGEFHTFAFEGPMFGAGLRVSVGEIVEREGFVYADVLPYDA